MIVFTIELRGSLCLKFHYLSVKLHYRSFKIISKQKSLILKIKMLDLFVTTNQSRYILKSIYSGSTLCTIVDHQLPWFFSLYSINGRSLRSCIESNIHTSAQSRPTWMKFRFASEMMKCLVTRTFLIIPSTCFFIFINCSHTSILHCLSFIIVNFSLTSANICFFFLQESLFHDGSILLLDFSIVSKASTKFFCFLFKSAYVWFQKLRPVLASGYSAWCKCKISLHSKLINYYQIIYLWRGV